MVAPILIAVIRAHVEAGYEGAVTYRSGSGSAASGSKSLLREYDEAILDAKLQMLAQCANFLEDEGPRSTSSMLAKAMRSEMKKDL